SLVSGNRAGDVRFAGVVSRDREQPVAREFSCEEFEIVESCLGGGEHVAAAVVIPVLLQAVAPACPGNELPEARSAGARIRDWIERAYDDREEGELERHAARFDLVDDVIEVAL